MNEPRAHQMLMLAVGLLTLLLLPDSATAACGGAGVNRVAASASRTDVNDCVTAAASGDTIRVPPGTATWSSAITLPANKDLALIGSSVVTCSGTPITCTAVNTTNIGCSVCFVINLGAAHRISGFTMTSADDGGIGSSGNQNPSKFFRIDHNRIVSTSGWAPMQMRGQDVAMHPQGIVDNNILVDIAIHSFGTAYQLDEGDQQHQLWAQQTPLGNSTAVVYIEDNHFQNTSGNVNNADANYAGRYVYRFNNTTSGRQTVEFHSVQGDNRAAQRFEIYGNTGSNASGFSGTAFIRGGSGVAFANRLSGSFSFHILLDNVRSEESVSVSGSCNGSSAWDQNASGQSGYRCRDQIGTSHDLAQWDHSPARPYNQAFQPVYFWDNRLTSGGLMDVEPQDEGGGSRVPSHIRENRDFYKTGSSFNGSAGVGEGPVANRPASCTPGVAYWATDEGEWNNRHPGPDGRLYKCTSQNTWTLYYTPYPYPHPWAAGGGGGLTPPSAPSNLRVN